MTERDTSAETQRVPTIAELLVELQNGMRRYDELAPQLEALKAEQESKDAALVDYDLEFAASQRLADVAFAALDKLVVDRKTVELERQVAECSNDGGLLSLIYRGHRVVVTAIDPDKEQIEDFSIDDGTYLGRKRDRHHGKIVVLGLSASDGGFIKFASRFARHQAGPLFDRENDYQPLFEIKEI